MIEAPPSNESDGLNKRLAGIRLLAMDVDGVLTDGRIALGSTPDGLVSETKLFDVKDGLGLSLARAAGLHIAWITGRQSPIVERRAAELGVTEVRQWARNKKSVLRDVQARLGLQPHEVLYIGDDLNDLPAFAAAGVTVAVADAVEWVRGQADWVTARPGGHGAVREVVERVLHAQDRWEAALQTFLQRLEEEQQSSAPSTTPVAQ